MTYNEAIREWLLNEPLIEDFRDGRECFEDDLIELRDDRELKLECLRLAISIQAAVASAGHCPQDPIEMASGFFEFVTA